MAAAARSGGGLCRFLSSLAELTKFGVDAVDQPRLLLLANYRIRGSASVASDSSAPQESSSSSAAATSTSLADGLALLPSTALMLFTPQVAPTLHRKIFVVSLFTGAAPAPGEVGVPLQAPHRQISSPETRWGQIYGVPMLTGAPSTASSVQATPSPLLVSYSFPSPRVSLLVRGVPPCVCFGFSARPSFSIRPSGGGVWTTPCSRSVGRRPYSTGSFGGEKPDCKYNEEPILNRIEEVGTKLEQVGARVDDVDMRLHRSIEECRKMAQDIKAIKDEKAASDDWTSVKIKGKHLNLLSVGQFLWGAARWFFKS